MKVETNLGLFGYMLTYGLFLKPYKDSKKGGILDKTFWLNEDCDGCGLCESVCQVNNIIMHSGKPTWHNQCVNCAACYHTCPKEAIQFGKDTMVRYTNPYVWESDFER